MLQNIVKEREKFLSSNEHFIAIVSSDKCFRSKQTLTNAKNGEKITLILTDFVFLVPLICANAKHWKISIPL